MSIELIPARREDLEMIWKMQVEAFSALLKKYQDYDMSPAAEPLEKIVARFEQPWTTYYFIVADEKKEELDPVCPMGARFETNQSQTVGAIRIVDKKDGSRKRISPLWIMPEFRGRGYAQQAILAAEAIHGADNWALDTILQEKGNLHLYEKLGYCRTGRIEHINDRMDIVFYEKG